MSVVSNREQNSIRNVTIGFINQIIILVLNFVSKTAIMRTLGADYLGIQGLYSNLFVLFSFTELGMAIAMSYSLYEPLAKKDTKKIAALYQYFKGIYIKLAYSLMMVGLLAISILKLIVKSELPYKEILWYYLLYLIATCIYNMYIFRTYLLIADQKKYIISLAQIVFDGGSLMIGAILLIVTKNYSLFLINVIVRNVLFHFVVGQIVKKKYPYLSEKHSLEINEKRTLLFHVKDLFLYKFFNSLIVSTDNIFISILIGTIFVGYYSNYQLVVIGVSSLIAVVFSSISASVGNLLVEQGISKQHDVFFTSSLINVWLVGFSTTCLYLLFQDFIRLWMGEKALLSEALVIIIVGNYYISNSRESTAVFREAAGMFAKIKPAMITCAISNIILSLILGWFYGMFGIFLATTISMLLTTFWYEPWLLYHHYFKQSGRAFLRIQFESVISVLLCILVTSLVTNRIQGNSWWSFFAKAIVCGIVSNLFYVGYLLLHKKEFGIVWGMVKHLFQRILHYRNKHDRK